MSSIEIDASPKVIVIVSILIALDVGTKLAQSYVILPTLSLLSWVFLRLLDLYWNEMALSAKSRA